MDIKFEMAWRVQFSVHISYLLRAIQCTACECLTIYRENWSSVCFSAPELCDLVCEVQDLGIRAQASTGSAVTLHTHTRMQCILVIRWRTWAQRARLCVSGLSVCSEVNQWGSNFGPLELQLTLHAAWYSTAHTHNPRQRWAILGDIPCIWMIYWIFLIYTVYVCVMILLVI